MNFNSILLTIIIVLLVVAGFFFGSRFLAPQKHIIDINPPESINVDMNLTK